MKDTNDQIDEMSHAQETLSSRLQELTANLLRIQRGAGKPQMLTRQIEKICAAIEEFEEEIGSGVPALVYANSLRLQNDRIEGAHSAIDQAIRKIERGVLQAIASRLLGQNEHISLGETEMFEGVLWLNEARQRNRN